MFYLLSLLTGILECGWLTYGVLYDMPLWQVLCFPLAYHIGNLYPIPFSLNKRCLYICAFFPILVYLTIFIIPAIGAFEFVLMYPCITALSIVMQSIRNEMKCDNNRLKKRIFRVSGFVLAPIAGLCPELILIFTAVIAIVVLSKTDNYRFGAVKMKMQKNFSLTMIFHQLHYFFYSHITLAVMTYIIGIMPAFIVFCGTWITYMIVEPIISKITSKTRIVFFVGHIGITILLGIMSVITKQSALFIVLWLITGFGGGTVYTISDMAKKYECYDKESMTIAENIGHIVGLFVAVTAAIISQSNAPDIMLMLGSASALTAVIVTSTIIFRNRRGNKQ